MINDTWLYFVILAHLLNAIVVLIDKHLVATLISRPIVYAFYVSLLSGVALVMVPFGVISVPTISVLVHSLIAAVCYLFSIVYLYKALQSTDPSDAIPVAGSLTAISTFIFSMLILGAGFTYQTAIGSALLIIGTLLISHFRFSAITISEIVISGLFSGISAVFTKMVFNDVNFANGFFWTRMANLLMALVIIAVPSYRAYIRHNMKHSSGGTKLLIVGNKFIAGFAALFILFAIKLAPVHLVNALAGLQYVFLLAFALFGSKHIPQYFMSRGRSDELIHKILATSLIVLGFVIFVS